MRCAVCEGDFQYPNLKRAGERMLCLQCYAARELQRNMTDEPAYAGRGVAHSIAHLIKLMVYGVLGLSLLAALFFGYTESQRGRPDSDHSTSAGAGDDQNATSTLPAIHINGDDQHILKFRDWQSDSLGMTGVMTCTTPTMVESVKFTARRNGTVTDRGVVDIAGNEIRKDEPTNIRMNFGDYPKSDHSAYDVTIEVQE